MQDSEYSLGKFLTLNKFVAEIAEMRDQLIELGRIKAELENEVIRLQLVEEELRASNASLEGQLDKSNAEGRHLSEKLDNEINERRRVEEEFRTIKLSFEEQLTRRQSEIERMVNDHKDERQAMKQALDNLHQQFNTLYKFSEGS